MGVGWAVVTRVPGPPRGCRWETDLNVHIGLRTLAHYRYDLLFVFKMTRQELFVFGLYMILATLVVESNVFCWFALLCEQWPGLEEM